MPEWYIHGFVYFQSSYAHRVSIAAMVNEKFRERVPPWEVRYL